MVRGWSAPNLLDLVLVLLLAYALVSGWRRGALSQVSAFGGFLVGLLVGAWAAPRVISLFVAGPGEGVAIATVAVLIVVALIGHAIGLGIGLRLQRIADRIGAGTADRVLGMGVGAAGLVLVVWLLASVLGQGPIASLAEGIRGSQAVRAIDSVLPPAPEVLGRISAYVDEQGFPQVFAGPGVTAPPVPATADDAVRAAAAAGQPSTVQVHAAGCGGVVTAGSGFVTRPGFIVTNAHVVAGFDELSVRDSAGEHTAAPILVDPELDLAVLAAPDVRAPPIGWASTSVGRGTGGAALGFPGGRSQLVVQPATVRGRLDAVGRDIYGERMVRREVLALSASVERGDSGGPFVTSRGLVGGVVFAGDVAGGTAYALTADEVAAPVAGAIARDQQVGVGMCRF